MHEYQLAVRWSDSYVFVSDWLKKYECQLKVFLSDKNDLNVSSTFLRSFCIWSNFGIYFNLHLCKKFFKCRCCCCLFVCLFVFPADFWCVLKGESMGLVKLFRPTRHKMKSLCLHWTTSFHDCSLGANFPWSVRSWPCEWQRTCPTASGIMT